MYVTGDIYYHTAHDAAMQGLNMIDPAIMSEKVMKKGLTATLQKMCKKQVIPSEIFPSEVNTDTIPICIKEKNRSTDSVLFIYYFTLQFSLPLVIFCLIEPFFVVPMWLHYLG